MKTEMGTAGRSLFFVGLIIALTDVNSLHAQSDATQNASPGASARDQLQEESNPGIWLDDIGDGFRAAAKSFNLSLGASRGVPILGGTLRHDLALASLSYGLTLGSVVGQGHWYRGNWEGRIELFGGSQFSPQPDWLVGAAPHIRYDFATGTRWVPYIDAGAGVTGTAIGPPDLSGTFEFNLQGCIGTLYFLRKDLALSTDARLLHLSCAGLHSPNLGLNTILGTIGMRWFF